MKDEVMKLYSYEGWGDELWIMSYGYGYGYGYYNRVHRDELEWLCFWAHEGTSECHVLKKVYTFYINTKIRLQFKYNPKIDLQSPFFCNNFSIYNLPF